MPEYIVPEPPKQKEIEPSGRQNMDDLIITNELKTLKLENENLIK